MRHSCLYECTVFHRRFAPKPHAFTYRVFLFLLDLDELDDIAKDIPIFGNDSANVYALRREDYFQFHSGSIRENLVSFLQSENFPHAPHRIRLLTLPRFLGYTFNPVSIFYCFDEAEQPLVSVIQVGNTFGELKPFVVPISAEGFYSRAPKMFYVSPFSDLDLSFDFRFSNPGAHLRIAIDDYDATQKTLVSTVSGQRRDLTLANLFGLTLKYPLITLKVIALIHWEAFRLWLKGVPHRSKEAEPHLQQGVFRGREESRQPQDLPPAAEIRKD